jgi:hypothetical protein
MRTISWFPQVSIYKHIVSIMIKRVAKCLSNRTASRGQEDTETGGVAGVAVYTMPEAIGSPPQRDLQKANTAPVQ